MGRWAPHPFTLRQLQYAVAVADQRSFRRAAEACAVAQPSLSAQVAQLEDALGVKLFERLPRAVLVTTAGAPLIDRMRRALVEADDLAAHASRLGDPLAGTLRVGVIPTVAPYLLPEVAPTLRAKLPRLRVLWREDKTDALLERLATGDVDAAILAGESELGELSRVELGRDPFVLAAPKGHPLAKDRGPLREGALDGETVLLLDDGHCFRDQALSVCQRAGADEASVRATSLSTLAQMVAGGAGVTLLPAIAVAMENRARALVVRPFGGRAPHRTLVLAWRASTPSEAALKALADVMKPAVGKLVAAERVG